MASPTVKPYSANECERLLAEATRLRESGQSLAAVCDALGIGTETLRRWQQREYAGPDRRALDDIFIEQFWRSVKSEEVYLKDYQTPSEARDGLDAYFDFYNHRRCHQALGYETPAAATVRRPLNKPIPYDLITRIQKFWIAGIRRDS